MVEITAAVTRAFGAPMDIETLTLRSPGRGEVEVAVKACAICHSDIAYADGAWGGSLPIVLGHEAAGEVVSTGPGVSRFSTGDRVLVTLIRSCSHCPACADGHPVACSDVPAGAPFLKDQHGSVVAQGLNCGAFADRVVVDQTQIAAIPDAMPMTAASLISCGVITGVGAVVNDGKLRPGEDAVVIGAGGVGLNAIQGARLSGARRIVAIDMSPEKLTAAKDFGATDGVLASSNDPVSDVREILGKGADAVFVSVGSPMVYHGAPDYLSARGRVVVVGMPPTGAEVGFELSNLAYSSQQVIGSRMGNTVLARDIPWIVDLYSQGRIKLDELVTGTWRLDQINDAIADTKSGAARRNVIVFD